jgi:hypothetical protein
MYLGFFLLDTLDELDVFLSEDVGILVDESIDYCCFIEVELLLVGLVLLLNGRPQIGLLLVDHPLNQVEYLLRLFLEVAVGGAVLADEVVPGDSVD